MNSREAYIALNMMDRIGPVRARALVEHLGSPEAVFSCDESDLMSVQGIGREIASILLRSRSEQPWTAERAAAEEAGIDIVTPCDEAYPDILRGMYDPPLALYVRGVLDARDRHAVAIVGSRQCTNYGQATSDRLSYQLAKAGFTVVSGLARGIDFAAHRGALKAQGRTVAVIGSGLFQLYPPEAEGLAGEIAETGAVISEYPLNRKPDKTTFPYRNRLISGLSLGVIVVEAGARSGALHTADAAMEQGRSVFAVPGRIDAPASRGTNRLIKQGAKLIDDVRDVFEEFEYLTEHPPSGAVEPQAELPGLHMSEEETALIRILLEGVEDSDEVGRRMGWTSAELSSRIFGLEMKKIIRMLPGRRIELVSGPSYQPSRG